MPTPLPELLAQVPSLDDPAQPFTFAVQGSTIVGRWDIVKATTLSLAGIEHIDRDYTITVEFNEAKGTFRTHERTARAETSLGAGGFSMRRESFSGTVHEKSFNLTLGGANVTDDGVSPVLAYSFDTARIKTPLIDFLTRNGWRKKGLFG